MPNYSPKRNTSYHNLCAIAAIHVTLTALFYFRFDPEHFGSCALQGKDAIAFSPFGMGRRKCPGYQFSYVEVTIFLTLLLQRFNLKPVSDKGVGMVHGLVTSPNEPLYYTVHPTASDESTTEE